MLGGAAAAAQTKERAEATLKVSTEQNCGDLKLGRAVGVPKPDYPKEAKAAFVGGTARVEVEVDEKGRVTEIRRISGHQTLQTAATKAARKAKFTPTVCDGKTVKAVGVLVYDFAPGISTERYFAPTQVKFFIDLKTDSPFYEAILDLTENHRLSFGYADQKFYADAPLLRGDFAHFLRLTLDALAAKAAAVNKLPREINLFQPRNPNQLTSINAFKNLKPSAPFYESVKTLLQKYDIVVADSKNDFQGDAFLTADEVMDFWTQIFGAEAIPVNFKKVEDFNPIISRGEFALFLQESLQVLNYKVLP